MTETIEHSTDVGFRAPAGVAARRRNHHLQTVRLLIAGDSAALALGALFGFAVTGHADRTDVAWIPFTVILTLIGFAFYRLYERDRQQIVVSTLDEWRDFLNALSVVCLLELVGANTAHNPGHGLATATIAWFWAAALVLLPLTRAAMRRGVLPAIDAHENTLIVGAGHVGQMLALKIAKHKEYNLRLVGFLDDEPHDLDPALANVPVLGGEDDLVELIRAHDISRVILAFSRKSAEGLLELIRASGLRDVNLSIVPRYFEI